MDYRQQAARFGYQRSGGGEYASITEHDGVMRTFRIIWVRYL